MYTEQYEYWIQSKSYVTQNDTNDLDDISEDHPLGHI